MSSFNISDSSTVSEVVVEFQEDVCNKLRFWLLQPVINVYMVTAKIYGRDILTFLEEWDALQSVITENATKYQISDCVECMWCRLLLLVIAVSVRVFVCLSTWLQCAKTAKRVTNTCGGPKNIVLDGSPDPPTAKERGFAAAFAKLLCPLVNNEKQTTRKSTASPLCVCHTGRYRQTKRRTNRQHKLIAMSLANTRIKITIIVKNLQNVICQTNILYFHKLSFWASKLQLNYTAYFLCIMQTGSLWRSDISMCLPLSLTSGCLRTISQPQCEKKNPRFALCGSASVSENLWCRRWSRDHSIMSFCHIYIQQNLTSAKHTMIISLYGCELWDVCYTEIEKICKSWRMR